MKREARLLLTKAKNSLVLSVDHFNRAEDRGRQDAAVIFLDHAFEMLLKAAIVQRGDRIFERGATHAIGFDACVRKSVSDGKVQFLTANEADLIRTINAWRDAVYHYLIDIPEQLLYLKCTAAAILFCDICQRVFEINLRDELPKRALPIATVLPVNIRTIFQHEVESIRQLLKPGSRKALDASARLRGLAIVNSSFSGDNPDVSPGAMKKLRQSVAAGKSWDEIFASVPTIEIASDGAGVPMELKITKKSGVPVRLVPADSDEALVIGTRRVNELGYYSLGLRDMAKKLGTTEPKTRAAIWHLDLQSDDEYFKTITIGKSKHKRYSAKALERLREFLKQFNSEEIWQKYRQGRRVSFADEVSA